MGKDCAPLASCSKSQRARVRFTRAGTANQAVHFFMVGKFEAVNKQWVTIAVSDQQNNVQVSLNGGEGVSGI